MPTAERGFFRYRLIGDLDADGDGLTAWEENELGSRDDRLDSDGDGISDRDEFVQGLDPSRNNAGWDTDGDGMSDAAEVAAGTNPRQFNIASGNTVGTTAGKLAVSNNGGGSYSIPIAVSPGTAGMLPKLSFEYSSRGGNGIMGVGWSVSGLSAITRVPSTLAQDGAIRGVELTADDRFAMDGQRLMVVNGTYGTDGAEYRTEIDSFTKVISSGSSGSGPRSFLAYTKSGLTYTFGESDDSRFLAQNRSEALTWALSKIADRSGNYILLHYANDSATGEYRVTSIEYTKNDGVSLASYAAVEFGYEDRPDGISGYVAGSQTQLRQRLKSVTSKYGSAIVRQYLLSYEQSPATAKSRLISIQEGAGDLTNPATLSFNPITFGWSDDAVNSVQGQLPESVSSSSVEQEKERWLQGDFTGDGRSDMARVTQDNNNVTRLEVVAAQAVSPGQAVTFDASSWPSKQSTNPDAFQTDDQWLSGDFDGDGKVDVLRLYQNSDRHCRMQLYSNGGGSFSDARNCPVDTELPYKTYMLVYPADMNGDGRLDLLAVFGNGDAEGQTGRNQYMVFLNLGASGTQTSFAGSFWGIGQPEDQLFRPDEQLWHVGDVNGDGLPDIVYILNVNDAYQLRAYINRNGSFAPRGAVIASGLATRYDLWKSGDFNGDGLLDLVRLVKSSGPASVPPLSVYLSTGATFVQQTWSGIGRIPDTSAGKGEVQVGDYDGDGRSDVGVVTTKPYNNPDPEPTPPCPRCVPYVAVTANTPTQQITYSEAKYMSNGTAGFRAVGNVLESTLPSQRSVDRKRWLQADFNGDGMEDLARVYVYANYGLTRVGADVWNTVAGVHDLLTSVTTKVTADPGSASTNSIQYKTLADGAIYTRSDAGDILADTIDLMTPMPVVAAVSYDNGTDTPSAVNYQYTGLKVNRFRGMLGFRAVRSTDSRTGIWSTTTLRQDYPFTGMVVRSETHQPNGGLLSLSTSSFVDQASQNGKVHMPYAQLSVAESYELDGTLTTRTTTTTNEVDLYGNTRSITVSSQDGWVKTTLSNYDVDTASWQIGKLRDSTVTSSAPGQPNVIRKSGFDYGPAGQVQTERIEPDTVLASTTSYTPDAFGNNKIATTSGPDVETRATTTLYDERGRFARATTNALGHTETKQYDERWGSVTSVTGPNGLTTATLYDDFGRERLTTRPDGSRTITTYHPAADDSDAPPNAKYFVRSHSDGGAPVTVFFDRLGREVRKKTFGGVAAEGNSPGILVDTVYNARGQIEKVSRPYFRGETAYFATTSYDLSGRPVRIETPKEGGGVAVTTTVYRGLEVESVNPQQQGTPLKTTTRKDSQGHLVKVTDAKNGTIDYTYDATGNLIETVQGGNVTKMTYDLRGRKKTMDDHDLGLWSYSYNSLGELISQTDAKGQTVTMQYDKLGRIRQRAEFEGVSTWQYDLAPRRGTGKLHIASFAPADANLAPYSRTMSFDDLGRPKEQTERIEGKSYAVSTGYGAFSRVETISYPSGTWVKQLYDANGYLNEVQREDGSAYWKAKSYDAEGHIKQQQAGNGVITDRVYVPETGVLKKIQSSVQNLEYEFDVIGNLKKRTDHRQTVGGTVLAERFEYDELNRVTKATVAGQSAKNFAYDLAGDITSKDGVGTYAYTPAQAETLSPNERSKPHAVRRIDNGPDATYDANGNMTSGFDRTLTWTSFNMPKLIQRVSTGSVSRFTYDVDHGRITQVAAKNGLTTLTVYVGGMYEEVNDGARIERKCYINSPAGRIAISTSSTQLQQLAPQDPPRGTVTSSVKYVHTDHLGSIDVITNESGAVLERDSFDAWGFRRETSWSGNNGSLRSIITRGYTGHEQLDDLGLVHMNGRVYDPGLGRFLSADPFIQAPTETQNFNRYSYVLNNPLSLTDPSGFNFLNNFGRWLTNSLGSTGAQIVIGLIAVGTALTGQYYITGALVTAGVGATSAMVVAAAGAGFSSAFISSSLSGASLGQAFQNGVITAGVAAFTAGVVGPALHNIDATSLMGFAGKALGHGLVGGALSGAANALQEGSFRDGFLGAFISQALGGFVDMVPGTDFGAIAARVAVSAAIGGTAAELGGGKFANGAVSAAFLRLYNDERGNLAELGKKDPKAVVAYAAAEMDKLVGKVGDKELAFTIDKNGEVRLGPESARSDTGSSPGTITGDTVLAGHFHLVRPGFKPYIFSETKGLSPLKSDEFFMNKAENKRLIHVVGVVDDVPGKFTIFYRAPGIDLPRNIYRIENTRLDQYYRGY